MEDHIFESNRTRASSISGSSRSLDERIAIRQVVVVAIGGMALKFSDTFAFTGIALGSLVTICLYHLCRYVSILVGTAPQQKKRRRVR